MDPSNGPAAGRAEHHTTGRSAEEDEIISSDPFFLPLLSTRRCTRMLDLLAALFAQANLLTPHRKPLAIDSTCFEQHHRSSHYDRRCRRMQDDTRQRPGKWGKTVNAARSRRLVRIPKLAI